MDFSDNNKMLIVHEPIGGNVKRFALSIGSQDGSLAVLDEIDESRRIVSLVIQEAAMAELSYDLTGNPQLPQIHNRRI
jgi:hypothetical protein